MYTFFKRLLCCMWQPSYLDWDNTENGERFFKCLKCDTKTVFFPPAFGKFYWEKPKS